MKNWSPMAFKVAWAATGRTARELKRDIQMQLHQDIVTEAELYRWRRRGSGGPTNQNPKFRRALAKALGLKQKDLWQ